MAPIIQADGLTRHYLVRQQRPELRVAVGVPLEEHRLEHFLAEGLVGGEGQLEGRALHVAEQDLEVVRVDAALLDRRPEDGQGRVALELVDPAAV